MSHTTRFGACPPVRQRGAILIVSLLLLLVMTILALSTLRASTNQERMSGNARDANLAFQSAEAGARGAERWLLNLPARPFACASLAGCTTSTQVVAARVLPELRSADADWWEAHAAEFGTTGADIEQVTRDPRYVVEEIGFVRDNYMAGEGVPEGRMVYRVHVHATGGTESAQAVIEATVARRF